MLDPEDVIQAITLGDCDDHVVDIVKALRERARRGAVEVLWRIEFDDLDITEENLTVAEAKIVEAALSSPKYPVSILTDAAAPAQSAKNIAAYIAAALMNRKGMDSTDAFKVVGDRGMKELAACLSEYTVTDPPKESSAPETPAT